MVAFHWAAGQIALGAFDGMPTNSLERFVFVLAMMVGFLFGSTLVSTLSAAMMDYQMMQKDKNHKIRTLRQYLRENDVDPTVALPVQKQVVQRLAQREKLEEKDVPALSLLSVALRTSLRFAIQKPPLMHHPMFRLWIGIDEVMMQRVCMRAVTFVQLRQKDDLFTAGSSAETAYTLTDGELCYTQDPDSSAVEYAESTTVFPGRWLSEAALWSEWIHVGRAEAVVPSQVLEIHAQSLLESVSRDMIISDLAAEYCKHFCRRVVSAGPPHAPWPNDLEVPFTDYCDLVVSMLKEVQVTIGMHAVQSLLTKSGTRGKVMDKLIDEVRDGKSIVVVTGEGDIIRVVSLVALRAERDDDGFIFAQVAKWERDRGEIKAACQMPGFKQERDELVGEAFQRLFNTKLQILKNKVDITGTVRENSEKHSKEYGVHTRYIRSVCSARLACGVTIDAPVCGVGVEKALSVNPGRAGVARTSSANASRPSVFQRHVSPSDTISDPANPAALGMDPADAEMLRSLQETPVIVTGSLTDSSRNLYAWLPPEAFASLNGGGKDHVLKAWVAMLRLPEAVGDWMSGASDGDSVTAVSF